MKSIGIITIHKINNYGSVLQAYALQKVCEDLGYKVEIIDYDFPNNFHRNNKYANVSDAQPNEPKLIKALFAKSLIKQHKGISSFVKNIRIFLIKNIIRWRILQQILFLRCVYYG